MPSRLPPCPRARTRPLCRRLRAFLFLLGLAPALCWPKPMAIVNVRIIDGDGGAPIENGTLVWEGNRVTAVGTSEKLQPPAGSAVIDGTGKSVMPGLADMHLHLLGGTNGLGIDMLGYQRYLNALLYAGVTTVLDTGNVPPFIFQLRAEVAAGRVLGPRIYCVGPLLDGGDPVWPSNAIAIVSKDQVPRIVDSLVSDKADFLKLYVGLSDELVRVISAEARKRGARTIIDQWSRNGSADLAETGIAGFAHFPSHRISDEAIATVHANHVFFLSTLAVLEAANGRRWTNMAFLDSPLIADTTPTSVLDALRKEYGGLSLAQLAAKSTYTMKVDLKGAEENVRRIYDAGILFAAGTDAVYPGDFQGEGLHRELELLVESGLTPLQAITAATKNASLILHAGKDWGTLAPGQLANLLLVDGRPDQHISDTRRIAVVVKEGTVLNRAALRLDHSHIPDYQEFGSSMVPVW